MQNQATELTMLDKTIELLKLDKGQWSDTAKRTRLGRPWIVRLASGKIENPGHTKVVSLYEYLAKKYDTKHLVP